jgi:hypothetical protein
VPLGCSATGATGWETTFFCKGTEQTAIEVGLNGKVIIHIEALWRAEAENASSTKIRTTTFFKSF